MNYLQQLYFSLLLMVSVDHTGVLLIPFNGFKRLCLLVVIGRFGPTGILFVLCSQSLLIVMVIMADVNAIISWALNFIVNSILSKSLES